MSGTRTETDRSSDTNVTRRRALQLAALTGSVPAIAGCIGDDGGTEGEPTDTPGDGDEPTTTDGDGEEEIVDATFTALTAGNPQQVDYNDFTPNTDWHTIGPMSIFLTHYTREDPTWVPLTAQNWEVDGDVFRLELNDSFTWHDGKSFTAEDVQFHHQFAQYMQAGNHYAVYDFADSVEVAEEYTVEYQLNQSGIAENTFLSTSLFEPFYMHPEEWSEYWEAFEDASSEDERQTVREDVLEFRLADPTTNGPLELVNRTAERYEFEVYEDWPWEEVQQQFTDAVGEDITGWGRPNFETVHINWAPDHQRMSQEWTGGNVSGGIPGGDLEAEQLPDGMELISVSSLYGIGMMWNLWGESGDPPGDEAWQDVNVRRAFAHIIDRDAVGVQYQDEDAPKSRVQTGMVQTHQDQWLDDELLEQMDVHDQDFDRAAEYLEASGYTEEGGSWLKPNGDPLRAHFHTSSGVNYYVRGFEVATSNLQEFGIDTELQTTESSTFFSQPYPRRDYQISTPGFWGGANPHPINAYQFVYERPSFQPEGADADETEYYMTETIGREFEVPPVGEPDSEDRITVNPHDLIDQAQTTTDEEEQREIIQTLAWATNQFVPKIECTELPLEYGINRNGWEFPESDSLALQMNPASTFWWHLGVVDAEQ